jgi:hypothetical protein
VLTESRQRTCESSGPQEDLADGRSRMAETRVELRGTRMEYATSRAVWWFGPQNHRVDGFMGLGLKTWAEVLRRNGHHMVASRSSCRGEAIS